MREDYSADGAAWEYLPHDHARSRAYRWGEDGILGISDNHQRLCFSLALWNEKDPILKERLFGLTGNEGNHGEDVKEYYYYLDSSPTHSYMKGLYKYPQEAYPYNLLVEETKRRTRRDPEFELIDTGVFHDDRYFDVMAEYAKGSPERYSHSRYGGQSRSPNGYSSSVADVVVPQHMVLEAGRGQAFARTNSIVLRNGSHCRGAARRRSGTLWWICERPEHFLFTENETNNQRLFGVPNTFALM